MLLSKVPQQIRHVHFQNDVFEMGHEVTEMLELYKRLCLLFITNFAPGQVAGNIILASSGIPMKELSCHLFLIEYSFPTNKRQTFC